MIRATHPTDTPALLTMTAGTGLFTPADVITLGEVLADYHQCALTQGHRCITFEEDGQPIGFAYYAPAPRTDRTWYLWWIIVSKFIQARGIGGQLLRHCEDGARAERGRLMMVETSGLGSYDLTRRFYVKQGYDVAAVLKDYYAEDHDMVVYRKRL